MRKVKRFIPLLLITGCCASSCRMEDAAKPGALVPLTVDQDFTLPSVHINGTHLHVESFGKPGDPLLFIIHGGPGGDYRSMLNARAYAKDGFHVVFYDQRGTGLSKRENAENFQGENAVQLFIDDLDALITFFRVTDTQKVFLMGHSWGAMLATGYINQHPHKVSGAVLSEPGGFSWAQTSEYLSRSNKVKFFSEALSDMTFPEQIFAGRPEHEILDYKAAFAANYENGPGNTIGNAGIYPFWRSGAVSFKTLIENAEKYGFDFTTRLHLFKPKILFLYSELNTAYGKNWAETVSSPYTDAELKLIRNSGHEVLHFGWADYYPYSLSYLNQMK